MSGGPPRGAAARLLRAEAALREFGLAYPSSCPPRARPR